MSVIDKVYQIEQEIDEIKQQGLAEISKLSEQAKEKEDEMKKIFLEEFLVEKSRLEQQVVDNIQKYETELFSTLSDKQTALQQSYQSKKIELINPVIDLFWQE